MFCHQCGKEMPDGGKFCPECGSSISGTSARSGIEKSLGEFKTLVRPGTGGGEAAGTGGLAVQMLSERYELGEEPTDARMVQVKSPMAFRAAYKDILDDVIVVAAPGAARPDLASLPWQRLPRPIYPLDPELTWP